MRTAIILTTYNRPKLVADAIESVFEQLDYDWRLYVMDDGCNLEARRAIAGAVHMGKVQCEQSATSYCNESRIIRWYGQNRHVVWWQGPDRSMRQRKSSISYSKMINIALNELLLDERYICYLCDDDWLPPDSVGHRADFLDANRDIHVCYGRLRAVQFDASGNMNTWASAGTPQPGREFLEPRGERVFSAHVGNARYYFTEDQTDPITGLPYVEEGYWQPGPFRYGERWRVDHNQVMHRRDCLDEMRADRPWHEFWPESLAWSVGDAGFFTHLAVLLDHEFHAVDCWAVCKRYHVLSDGVSTAEVRE